MGWAHEYYQKAKDLLNSLTQDKKSMRVIFGFVLGFLILTFMLCMFSMEFVSSWNPALLLSCGKVPFSYAGSPIRTLIYSDNYNFGIVGINNTMCMVNVNGTSNLTMTSPGIITISVDGSTNQIARNYTINMFSGDNVSVTITVPEEDDINYNMIFTLNNKNGTPMCTDKEIKPIREGNPENITEANYNWLRLFMMGNNQYKIYSRFNKSVPKTFVVKDNGRLYYPINVSIINNSRSDNSAVRQKVTNITYTGHIDISTYDNLSMVIPATRITEVGKPYLKYIAIMQSDGTLDVRHIDYKCSHADNILVESETNSTSIQLCNGRILARGEATKLNFRMRDFTYPWTVIFKEGNFVIFFGLISTLLTITLGWAYKKLKK